MKTPSPRPGSGSAPLPASSAVDSLYLAGKPRQREFFRALKAATIAAKEGLEEAYIRPLFDTAEELWNSVVVENVLPIQEECHLDTPLACAGTFALHVGIMTVAVATWEDTLLISVVKGQITRLKKEKFLTDEEAKKWGKRVDLLFIAKDIGNVLKDDIKYAKDLEPLEDTKLRTSDGMPNKTTTAGKQYYKTQAENTKAMNDSTIGIAGDAAGKTAEKLDEKDAPLSTKVRTSPGHVRITVHFMTPIERARWEAEKAAKQGNSNNRR